MAMAKDRGQNTGDKGHSNSRIIIYAMVKDTVGRQTNNKNVGKRTEAEEGDVLRITSIFYD